MLCHDVIRELSLFFLSEVSTLDLTDYLHSAIIVASNFQHLDCYKARPKTVQADKGAVRLDDRHLPRDHTLCRQEAAGPILVQISRDSGPEPLMEGPVAVLDNGLSDL